jgi:PAS domain S-box-containing protein
VNAACCRFFGRRRDELLGLKFLDLLPERARGPALNHIRSLAENPRIETYEHEVALPDGSVRWQQWADHAIVGPDGRVIEFQAIGQDITDRKRAEEARRNLAHATRVSMLGALAGSLAHELNQPLTAILSNAQAGSRFLANSIPDIAEIRGLLHDIAQDTKRAGEVIRQLRMLVKKDEPKFETLDLNRLIQDVVRLLRSDTVIRKVGIALDLDSDLRSVRGDSVQLQQVMLNLMLNGFDAMKEVPESERKISVRTRQPDTGLIQIEVSDCGTGIHPEQLARVFEPFQSTKPDGLGLGLSISRSIVEAHAGRLWAENNPDRGATFYLTLPVHSAGPNSE